MDHKHKTSDTDKLAIPKRNHKVPPPCEKVNVLNLIDKGGKKI